jgi:hypothetical protein
MSEIVEFPGVPIQDEPRSARDRTAPLTNINVIPEGQRHSWVIEQSGALLHEGITKERIVEILGPAIAAAEQSGNKYTEAEFLADIEDACRRWDEGVPFQIQVASDIEAKPVEWFVPGRIPLGCLTVLTGRQGSGKTQTGLSLAVTASVGGTFIDGTNAKKGRSLIVTAEDDPARRIRPLLGDMGADLKLVDVLSLQRQLAAGGDIDLASESGRLHLRNVIEENGYQFVFLDGMNSFLGNGARDTGSDRAMRRVLTPLSVIAEETGAAIVYVLHLNKDVTKGFLLDRVMDSTAHTAVARSVLVVRADPQDPDRRMFDVAKLNLAPRPEAWLFRVDARGVEWISTSTEHYEDWGDETGSDAELGREVEAAILDALGPDKRAWGDVLTEVRRETGCSASTALRARATLTAAQQIDKEKIPRGDGKVGGGPTVWFQRELLTQPPPHHVDEKVIVSKLNSPTEELLTHP